MVPSGRALMEDLAERTSLTSTRAAGAFDLSFASAAFMACVEFVSFSVNLSVCQSIWQYFSLLVCQLDVFSGLN